MLIGSKAIKHWFPDFNREPNDEDRIVNDIQLSGKVGNIEYLYNPILPFEEICSPNNLLTLKMSHIFWEVGWEKHMWDIQFLLKKGCTYDIDLFYKLYSFWNKIKQNKRSNLQMSANVFFTNAVNYPVSHDDLHYLLKETPTFTKVLIGEVEVGEDKFNLLSFEEKLSLVEEEIMVMAFERYQGLDYRVGYYKMLKKFIINHAPMWEALFIIKNFIVLSKPSFDYFTFLNNKSRL